MIELLPNELGGRVLALNIRGPIERSDIEEVAEAFETQLKLHKPLRIYAEIQHSISIEPDALLEDLKLSFQHFRDVDRVAVVVDEAWLARLVDFAGLVPGIDVRQFGWPERDKAREWMMS